jgi:hypothetical protein
MLSGYKYLKSSNQNQDTFDPKAYIGAMGINY